MKAIKHGRKILMAAVMAVAWYILGMTAESAPEIQESQTALKIQESQDAPEIQEVPVKNTYIIDKNGAGDFKTIQEGANQASDGDTLVIYPGIYTEEVSVIDKGLNIIGVNRDSCIIQYDTTSYMHMPLTIGAGKVSNLTIYGMSAPLEQMPAQADVGVLPNGAIPLDWQKDCPGYAVHIDQSVLYKRSLSFENCLIVSENNACVGIGGRGESTITFENCEMVSLKGGGCIYLHDPISLTESGETAFILKNCSLINCRSPYVMTFWSYMPEINSLKLTFQNTRVSAVAYDDGHAYTPANLNSFWDVKRLMQLEDNGSLYMLGLTSTAAKLVHELTIPESKAYIRKLNETIGSENVLASLEDILPEGITYLHSSAKDGNAAVKRQVTTIYNSNNMPGNGWCGLNGAYLTPDSFGNTLPEMNAPIAIRENTVASAPKNL